MVSNKDVPVAQTVEHLPFKERVVGSSPTGYIQLRSHFRLLLTKNLTARFQTVKFVFEAVYIRVLETGVG